MAEDDLRRLIALRHLEQAEKSFPIDEENAETDGLGDLPSSFKSKQKNSQDGPIVANNDESSGFPQWREFFEHNERLTIGDRNFEFNCYFTLPSSPEATSIPVFIFHHGAGSSALSFANLSKYLLQKLDGKCAVFAFDARGHGQTRPIDRNKAVTYDLSAFVQDFVSVLNLFHDKHLKKLSVPKLSVVFVGHSLGASICTFSHSKLPPQLQEQTLGICMLDIVEEAAILALEKVHNFLSSTPNVFKSYKEAIDWHVSHGLSKCRESAEVAIPALFSATKSQKIVRITNLKDFEPYWSTWFQGLSHEFVSLPTSKLLLLAGNDNLDKELIIGQMQGKYQLVVFQDSGHFIQEDVPIKTAVTLIDFWKRNDSQTAEIKSTWGKKQ